jgi:hypothetical protein
MNAQESLHQALIGHQTSDPLNECLVSTLRRASTYNSSKEPKN